MNNIKETLNEREEIKCFTDASYSQQKSLSIVGYKIGNLDVILEELPNIKNTQAELYAVEKCIDVCNKLYPNKNIIIYTDCQRALKNQYQKNVTLEKIEGHKKTLLKNENDKIFSGVDKAVRKKLRNVQTNNKIESVTN